MKTERSHFEGDVYNLQIEEDESFIADGIVVHNCICSLGLAVWGLVGAPSNIDPLERLIKKSYKRSRILRVRNYI